MRVYKWKRIAKATGAQITARRTKMRSGNLTEWKADEPLESIFRTYTYDNSFTAWLFDFMISGGEG